MSNAKIITIALGAAFAASMALSHIAAAAENPFATQQAQTTQIADAADGKCGGDKAKMEDGKCGGDKAKMKDGKCGGDKAKKKDGKCGGDKAKMKDGKCGGDKKEAMPAGKCGGDKQ